MTSMICRWVIRGWPVAAVCSGVAGAVDMTNLWFGVVVGSRGFAWSTGKDAVWATWRVGLGFANFLSLGAVLQKISLGGGGVRYRYRSR